MLSKTDCTRGEGFVLKYHAFHALAPGQAATYALGFALGRERLAPSCACALQLLGVALGVGGAVLATLSVPAAAHPGAMQNSSTDRTSSDSSAAKASVFFGLQARPAFPSAPEPDYRI